MADPRFSEDWIEVANCLATVARTLSSAVHEANNMLQVIAGSAEMIQLQRQVPEPILKRSIVIAEHAHKVSGLLGSVRDLSKFPPRRPADATKVQAVVHDALDLRRHALNRGHIAVTLQVDDDAVVRASWRPMLQIVLNLILNAEAALAGGQEPAIAIQARRDGDDVVLVLEDNGRGLSEQGAEPGALTPSEDAAPLLGIGLAATRFIVERDGGRLDLEPRARGTAAIVRMPAA